MHRHTHTHTYTHTCIYTDTHGWTHTCIDTHSNAWMDTHTHRGMTSAQSSVVPKKLVVGPKQTGLTAHEAHRKVAKLIN